jgi:hypothetical protein
VRALLPVLLVGCGPKEIPPHLRPDPAPTVRPQGASAPPTTPLVAANQVVSGDPLVRRAAPREPGHWAGLPEESGVAAWAVIARSPDAPPATWFALEQRWPGTLAVPLARGGRLAALEIALAGANGDATPALPWVGPVVGDGAPLPAAAREPLAWLGGPPQAGAASALHVAERAVLLGWLDAPGLPVTPAVAALQPGVHDRLTTTPSGALLVARAGGAAAPDRAATGEAALVLATKLALLGAAADRDAEQARHAAALDAARTGEDDLDPVARLLDEATLGLSADASRDASTGLALVALTAARLRGSCPDTPCGGLDRLQTLAAAERWGATGPAALWRVIALKGVLDRLDVARDRPSFPGAIVDLADVLVGLGASTVPERLIRARRPDPAVWLAVSRAADGGDGAAWEDARAALAAQLMLACDAALPTSPDDEHRDALSRIRRRAGDAP